MKVLRKFTLLAGIFISTNTPLLAFGDTNDHKNSNDWRKIADTEKQLSHLIKVIPGTADIMIQMGERYKNLYWAAKLDKWEFAAYQMEEMQSLIRKLMITRPKRTTSANIFLQNGFNKLPVAIEAKSWQQFRDAFANMRKECLACHIKNNHAFIRLPSVPPKGSGLALFAE
ncbi:MAG: hypothetical protein KAR30_00045 [Gammaproteobacteria bacterium]|nr:hypothetical protein [Gammaproteobacteria bacterium]